MTRADLCENYSSELHASCCGRLPSLGQVPNFRRQIENRLVYPPYKLKYHHDSDNWRKKQDCTLSSHLHNLRPVALIWVAVANSVQPSLSRDPSSTLHGYILFLVNNEIL